MERNLIEMEERKRGKYNTKLEKNRRKKEMLDRKQAEDLKLKQLRTTKKEMRKKSNIA